MPATIDDPVVVGKVGKVWLIAGQSDMNNNNRNGVAQTYNERTKSFSEMRPLQQWLKFGTWEEVADGTQLP